ncbi:MAG: flagellin [Planctomycetota bacterium]
MGLRINTNLAAINARRNLEKITFNLSRNYTRLATGLRIANASDDAAGLAISERLRAQVRSLEQAKRNASDGISLLQVGEGALIEVSSILVRMRELAVQANNGTVSDADKDTLQQEFGLLMEEIDRIAQSTNFNNVRLFDGSVSVVTFQIGSGTTAGVDTLEVSLSQVGASSLGLSGADISSAGSPVDAINAIDGAINTVSAVRGNLGATQNRLNSTIANLGVTIENFSAAESRIRDIDVASETADLTRNSILQQAAISVLAQANVQPQAALNLLA